MSLHPTQIVADTGHLGLSTERVQTRYLNEINAELTPGLIHEVNNVLTGIYFNLESCREGIDAAHPMAEPLQEIQAGVERIKTVLGRITQIHLNAADRELNYHELQALVSGQIDLLQIIFPKTARISLTATEEPLFLCVSEESFRVGLLALATSLRGLYPEGKIEIPLSIVSPLELARMNEKEDFADFIGVSFRLPCLALSVSEIDDFHSANLTSDISMANTEAIICATGGRLLFSTGQDLQSTHITMIFPQYHLNSQH